MATDNKRAARKKAKARLRMIESHLGQYNIETEQVETIKFYASDYDWVTEPCEPTFFTNSTTGKKYTAQPESKTDGNRLGLYSPLTEVGYKQGQLVSKRIFLAEPADVILWSDSVPNRLGSSIMATPVSTMNPKEALVPCMWVRRRYLMRYTRYGTSDLHY